nr:HesA/MoeB/ThiF family protein [Brevibacterium yomogidense]
MQVPGVGAEGQARLGAARVLLVGAGGLGSPAGLYLAAAGIGTIGIVDDDRVERSNLHRQIVHRTDDEGRLKVESAADALRALNPEVTVVTHTVRLTADTVMDVVDGYDVVVDGADSFATRYVVSDACTLLDIPHVWAAVLTDGGQLSVFHGSKGPVYRDLLPVMPPAGSVPSCAVAGVLGTVPGVLGTAMAGEVLKLVLGIGRPAIGRVLVYDMLTAEWETVPLARSPHVERPRVAADVGRGVPQQVNVAELARVVGVEGGTAGGDRAAGVSSADAAAGADADAGAAAGADRRDTALRSETPAQTAVSRTSGRSLAERSAVRSLVVDVRTPAEAAAGMIPGARLLPIDRIEEEPEAALSVLREWSQESTEPVDVYLHCQAGSRSARAQEVLGRFVDHDAGLRLHDLAGGYEAWIREFPNDVTHEGEDGSTSGR